MTEAKPKTLSILLILLLLVVRAYAQPIEKSDSTANTSDIRSNESVSERKDLISDFHIPQETNFVNSIASKTSGVLVRSNSGSPGASSLIRIRGNRSILFDNSPLIIIDGIPIDNSISENSTGGVDYSNRAIDINEYDIESIQLIKSAYANVIYGIRGANGVVLITTKSAEENSKMKINFNFGVAIDKVNKLPGYQTEYAQGRPVGGLPQWRGPETSEGFSWGPAIADLEFDGSNYPYDKNGRLVPIGTGNGKKAIGHNNLDNQFVNGLKYNFNTSISGSNKKLVYYFTAGLLNQEGVIPNSDFYRKSLKLNLGYEFLTNLTAQISFSYINSGSNNRTQKGANLSGVPLGLFRTSPSFDNGNEKKGLDATNDPSTYQLPDGTQRSYRAGVYDSPYWSINKNPTSTDVDRIIGHLFLNYDLNSHVSLGYKLGIDRWKSDGLTGTDINSAKFPIGMVDIMANENIYLNSDFTVKYKKSISKDLSLEALLGYNYFSSSFSRRNDSGIEFIQAGIFSLSNTLEQTTTLRNSDQRITGLYLSLDLVYANQISLNVSARNDWSSVLPSNNNNSTYYGAEVVWDIAQALKKKALLGLSVFGSWGKTGNRPGAQLTSTYYNPAIVRGDPFISGIPFPQYGVDGYELKATSGSPDLGPEISKGYEVGLDLDVIDSRIGLNYTYYSSKTSNVVLLVPVSANTGFQGLYMNTAEVVNSGHEISFFATPLRNKWKWDISINFSRFKNVVNSLNENINQVSMAGFSFSSGSSNAIDGEPYGTLYGNSFRRNEAGKLVIGLDGWPLVDNEPRVLGNPNPDWVAGIYNKLSFKGMSLSFLFDIRRGGDIWNGTSGVMNYFGTSQLTADERNITGFVFDGVVVDSNGEPSNILNSVSVDFADPAAGVGGSKWTRYGLGGLVEENIQDGSWVRLRETALTYQLPPKWLSKIGIKSSSVSITGRNLLLITKYTGIDPETNLTGNSNGFGIDYFNSPNTKSYGLIFNFNI